MADAAIAVRCRPFSNLHLATRASFEVFQNMAVLESSSQAVPGCVCTVLSYFYTPESVSLTGADFWLPLASKCITISISLIGTAVVLYQIVTIWSEHGWKCSLRMIFPLTGILSQELFHLKWFSLPHSWLLAWQLTASVRAVWEFSITGCSGSWNFEFLLLWWYFC